MHIVHVGCIVHVYGASDNVYIATQCEGGIYPLMLSCPDNRRLMIRSAMFGRRDWNTTCHRDTATPTDNCLSQQAIDVVQSICNGQ